MLKKLINRFCLLVKLAEATKKSSTGDLELMLERVRHDQTFTEALGKLLRKSASEIEEDLDMEKPIHMLGGNGGIYQKILGFKIQSSGYEYANKGWVVATPEGSKLALQHTTGWYHWGEVSTLKTLLQGGDADNEKMKEAIEILTLPQGESEHGWH